MSHEQVKRVLCAVSMCGQRFQWIRTYSGRTLLLNRDRDIVDEHQPPPKYKSARVGT